MPGLFGLSKPKPRGSGEHALEPEGWCEATKEEQEQGKESREEEEEEKEEEDDKSNDSSTTLLGEIASSLLDAYYVVGSDAAFGVTDKATALPALTEPTSTGEKQDQKKKQRQHDRGRRGGALTHRPVDKLCQGCVEFEESGKLAQHLEKLNCSSLWCAGCWSFHGRGLFSAAQRQAKYSKRRCIGLTGRMRVCPHLSISWEMVKEARKRHKAEGGWMRRGSIFVTKHVPYFLCPKGCAWQGCALSYPVRGDEVEDGKKDGKKDGQEQERRMRTLQRKTDYDSAYWLYRAGILWGNRLLDVDPTRPPLRQDIQGALHAVNTAAGGPNLCPHMRIDDARLMAPPQAPRCVCFPAAADDDDDDDDDDDSSSDDDYQDDYYYECHGTQHKKTSCVTVKGDNSHKAKCDICRAKYVWTRVGDGIHLKCESTFSTSGGPTNKNWIRKLDPHAWGITDDDETKHVFWCPTTGCETNHQWRALYRRLQRY